MLANSLDPEDKRIQEMLVELEKMKIESIQEESKEEEEDGKEEVEEEEIKENTSDQTSEKLNQPTTELPATTIPYLVENGVMTESFYKVLLTIFNHFDQSSKDGAWSPKELENFFITVNGVPPDNATKLAIKQQFKTNTKGWLLLEGFFELYLSQTAGDPQETWKDLKKLGFDELLKPIPQMGIFSN